MRKKELVLIWGLILSLSIPASSYASKKGMANELELMPDTRTVTYNNYTLKGEGTGNTRFGSEWEAEHLLPYVLYHKNGNVYQLYDGCYENDSGSGVYYFKDNDSGGIEIKAGNYYQDSHGNYHSIKGKEGADRYYWSGSDWVLYEKAEAEDNRFDGQLQIREAAQSDDTIYNKVYLLDGKDIHPDKFKYWDPIAFTSTNVSKDWFRAHSGEQTKNKASVSTLYNHPQMRKAVEDLLGVDKLYNLDHGSTDIDDSMWTLDKIRAVQSGYDIPKRALAQKNELDISGINMTLNTALYNTRYDVNMKVKLGTMGLQYYDIGSPRFNVITADVLSEDSSGEAVRQKLAGITSDTLGLEGNLPCSWAVPLHVYYNKLDNNRGLLKLPSSLNDSISKRDYINLIQSVAGEFNRKADKIDADDQKVIDKYKDLQAAQKLGEELAVNPYEGAALGAYFAHNCTSGNFYGREDANQKSLDSKITRLEALYNMCDMVTSRGLSSGWFTITHSALESGGYLYDAHGVSNSSAAVSLLSTVCRVDSVNESEKSGLGPTEVYIDYSLDELTLDDVKINTRSSDTTSDTTLDGVMEEDIGEELDETDEDYVKTGTRIVKNVLSTKKVAVGKQKISKKEIDYSLEKGKWVNVKFYKFQKKVNGKIKYKWAEKKPGKGWKYVYKVKYKTVKETEEVLRVGFSEINYTKKNIKQLNRFMDKYFRDASDYHIMTVEEIAEAKEKVDYYKVWATEGRTAALAKFNALAMSKKMLTPETAVRLLDGYACGLFIPDKDGNLNLFSEATWGDVLTWATMKSATNTICKDGRHWTGYEKYTNAKEYQWDREFADDVADEGYIIVYDGWGNRYEIGDLINETAGYEYEEKEITPEYIKHIFIDGWRNDPVIVNKYFDEHKEEIAKICAEGEKARLKYWEDKKEAEETEKAWEAAQDLKDKLGDDAFMDYVLDMFLK